MRRWWHPGQRLGHGGARLGLRPGRPVRPNGCSSGAEAGDRAPDAGAEPSGRSRSGAAMAPASGPERSRFRGADALLDRGGKATESRFSGGRSGSTRPAREPAPGPGPAGSSAVVGSTVLGAPTGPERKPELPRGRSVRVIAPGPRAWSRTVFRSTAAPRGAR